MPRSDRARGPVTPDEQPMLEALTRFMSERAAYAALARARAEGRKQGLFWGAVLGAALRSLLELFR